MQITCSSCSRAFEIDEQLARETRYARCVCDARLDLVPGSNGKLRLGKYVLIRRIAVGGMGEIFYGKIAGAAGFEREVAIKKMLPHLSADQSFIDMMIKEAKLTVLLNHPNIVQVYDLAKQGNEYYIAMEYVPGVNLGRLLEQCYSAQERLPIEVAIHIVMQVLRGLAYAHDLREPDGEPMHVLHRDITPQNILVTPNAWVKITDFGIAKARNEISTTSPGIIKGKLGYIAPEQLAGQQPDQRVDLFCAAICLWEALATRRLFKGADEVDTFRLISEAKVPPLSRFRDDVPAELEAVLHKGLARRPEERYSTADEFYEALSKAIFPHAVDDYAAVAKRYFHEHPGFFDQGSGAAVGEADALTTDIDMAAPTVAELTLVTELVGRSQAKTGGQRDTKGRSKTWLSVAAALVVIVGGIATYLSTDLLRRGVRSAQRQPAGASTAAPLDPRMQPLSQAEVDLAVRAARVRLDECYCKAPAALRDLDTVRATLVIASTGGVGNVSLEPQGDAWGAAGACVSDALLELLFRPNAQPLTQVQVTLPAPREAKCARTSERRNIGSSPSPRASGPLSAEEIQAVLQRHSASIVQCMRHVEHSRTPPKISAQLAIATSGRVTDVELTPALPSGRAGECLEKILKSIRFRPQPQKDFKVILPLQFQVL